MAVMAMIRYGHKYGQMICLLKDWEKCRSPVQKIYLLLRFPKSYGRNNIMANTLMLIPLHQKILEMPFRLYYKARFIIQIYSAKVYKWFRAVRKY